MVKYNREVSSNIIDKRNELTDTIISSMKRERKRIGVEEGTSMNAWDYGLSPTPISPVSMKFEKNLKTDLNYSFQARSR